MHSVYVAEVGLSSPLTAEVQFVDCVISALFLAWPEKNPKSPKATAAAPITLPSHICKGKADETWLAAEEPSQPPRIIRSSG